MEFNKLKLHDSSIDKIEYEFDRGELVLTGKIWCSSVSSIKAYGLVFKQVSNVSIPNVQPWGKSNLVNSQVYSNGVYSICLLYTSPSPRGRQKSRMPSSA